MLRSFLSCRISSALDAVGGSSLSLLSPSCLESFTFNQLPGLNACHQWRSATKKAGGTASQKNATIPKNLGVKMLGGELAFPGQIILRQRGTKYHAGQGVGIGKDHTIFSTRVGFVAFQAAPHLLTNGKLKDRMTISVQPLVDGDEAQSAEEDMIKRRAQIKRDMNRGKPFEPALYFPHHGLRGTKVSRRPSLTQDSIEGSISS